MKLSRILATAAMLACVGLTTTGCFSNKNKAIKDRLYIVYYPGGYGEEYLETFVKEYLAETKGVSVDQITSKDYYLRADENCTYQVTKYLELKDKAPDIIISNFVSPTNITNGLVEPLNDLFESEVTTSKGQVAIKDYCLPEAYKRYEMQVKYGRGKKYIFGMPWTSTPLSMVCNETLLKKVSHQNASGEVGSDAVVNGKWNRAPETVVELKTYFNDIDAYNKENGKEIVKFGWSLNAANWFESLIMTWWAQKQGVDVSRIEGQGSYYDFWNLDSPELYKQIGIQDALNQIKELFCADGKFSNSFPNPDTKDFRMAQTDFAKGEVAICLTGDFFAKEYEETIAEYGQTFKMMRVPSIDGAELKEGTDEVKKLAYLNLSSVAYIPHNSLNIDLAKGFLKYCCQEQQLLRFTKMAGGMKPYGYNPLELDPTYDWPTYMKSVFEVYYNSDDIIVKYPRNAETISPVYLYEDLKNSFLVGSDFQSMMTLLKTQTAQEFMVDGKNSVYKNAKKYYDETLRSLYNLDY